MLPLRNDYMKMLRLRSDVANIVFIALMLYRDRLAVNTWLLLILKLSNSATSCRPNIVLQQILERIHWKDGMSCIIEEIKGNNNVIREIKDGRSVGNDVVTVTFRSVLTKP